MGMLASTSAIAAHETLWPEFEQINATMCTYLDEVTDRIIADVIHSDSFEAPEVAAPPRLGPSVGVDSCA